MSMQRRSAAALVPATGAVALLAFAPAAAADPVWPSAGDRSAAATIEDLQAQDYNVQINWVNETAFARCRSAPSRRFTTRTGRVRRQRRSPPFMSMCHARTIRMTPASD